MSDKLYSLNSFGRRRIIFTNLHRDIWCRNVDGVVTKVLWRDSDLDMTRTVLRMGKRELDSEISHLENENYRHCKE